MKLWMSGLLAASAALLAACGQSGDQTSAGTDQTASAEPMTCEELAGLTLPETTISSAVVVPAGPFEVPGGGPRIPGASAPPPAEVPSFCRVSGVIAPDNHFEVWLPMKDVWNGRFQMVGGGGLAGNLTYNSFGSAMGALIPNVKAGYATASTDTGHVASDYTWLRDPAKVIDYGYRSIHETAVKSKAILAAFYGRPADYNYFNGCSTGGRQGLMEAQRYPDDFDGIVSGAPVNWFVKTHVTQLWMQRAAQRSPAYTLSPENLATINKAVMAQCDAMDGLKDGLLNDPRACNFDPGTLLCKKGQTSDCLTAEQIDTAREFYKGPVDPKTGEAYWVGMEPGSEAPMGFIHGWTFELASPDGPTDIPKHYFGDMVFQDDNWDWKTFDFDKDIQTTEERTGQILNAIDPNLDAFSGHGGKLILYHGWDDPLIFPAGTVRYYGEVVDHEKAKGAEDPTAAAQAYARLFMVPGMGHCRGGPEATDNFDAQSAVEAWVEKGEAPDRILASHKYSDGKPDRTRPLCPYPAVAKYDGQGDSDKAESFSCAQ